MDIPLDALVTLILFPIVYTPLAAPPEVKLIVLRRPRWVLIAIGLPFGVSILAFVLGYISFLQQSIPPELLWPGLILFLLVINLTIVLILSNQFTTHDGIIKLLIYEAERNWRKRRRLSGTSVNDLIDLGKKSESFQTKELILNAIYDLSIKVCNHHDYNGDHLDGLMLRVVEVLVTNNSGNPETFIKPIQVLQSMVNLSRDKNTINTVDLEHTLKSISLLSNVILQKSELNLYAEDLLSKYNTTLEYVADVYPILLTRVGQSLYEIGIQSAKKELYVPARLAISKLIILCNRSPDVQLSANVLGLFAFLWSAGSSVKASVIYEFEYFTKSQKKPIPRMFDAAIKYFTINMQFETSNKLTEMASEVKRGSRN